MSNLLVRTTLASLPTASHFAGGTLAQLTTDEELYIVKGGAWLNLRTGGAVTLAGDVTGASTDTTVVRLRGSAGVVSMAASQLKWAAGVDFVLSHVSQSGDVAAREFALALQTPSGSATSTRRNSPSGSFVIPAPTAGGVNGRWIFYHDTQESLAIADSKVTLGVNSLFFKSTLTGAAIQFESGAGASNTLTIAGRTSTDNVGGTTVVASGAGGGGNPAGDLVWRIGAAAAVTIVASSPAAIVHLHGNSLRWSETSTPVYFQEQRTNDAACHDTTIQSQAPYATALTNRLPGNLIYVVPAPSDGTDPHGWHQFKISGDEIVKIDKFVLSSHAGIQFMDDFLLSGTNSIYCERAAAEADGQRLFIEGQRGGTGAETNGGDVFITGGIPTGSGEGGEVGLFAHDSSTSVLVTRRDAGHSAVVLCGAGFTPTKLPLNMTNFVFIGNSAGNADTAPVDGCVFAAVSGQPYFLNSSNRTFGLDLENLGGTFAAPPGLGTFYGWVKFGINDTSCVMPVWQFA